MPTILHVEYEGEFWGRDGVLYNYADFVDQAGDAPLRFTATNPKALNRFYTPEEIDGVCHCYEMHRDPALTLKGAYRIEVTAFAEVCVAGWWSVVQKATFELEEDAARFAKVFRSPTTVVSVSKVVRQTSYTPAEADAEKARIVSMANGEGWSNKTVAAYLAHVTRRTAKVEG